MKTSIQSSSRWVYCHSARSVRCRLYLDPASSDIREYVDSGGRNANLAAILDGHGGQQNNPHNSLNDKLFMVMMKEVKTLRELYTKSVIFFLNVA